MHMLGLLGTFTRPKWQISLPFQVLQQLKSLTFQLAEAWKKNPFRAEPPHISHHWENPPPPSPLGWTIAAEKNELFKFSFLSWRFTMHIYYHSLVVLKCCHNCWWLCDGRRANRTPLSRRQGCGKQRPGVPTYDIADNFANGLEGGESHLLQLRGASNTNCQSHHALWQLHCRNLPLGIKHRGSMQTPPRHLFRYIQE